MSVDRKRRPATSVLVLGGTHEGRVLADRLVEAGLDVVLSLARPTATGRGNPAGRPTATEPPPREAEGSEAEESGTGTAEPRTGGFAATGGLGQYLAHERIAAVIDATHPWATQMSEATKAATAELGIPRLRLLRPPWVRGPGDRWQVVADLDAAAATVGASGWRRVFLALGGRHLHPFAGVAGVWFLVRAIETPEVMPLGQAAVVIGRGPFAEAEERDLLVRHRIDAIVARDSGGTMTDAKLAAARSLGLPVVMVERPPALPGPLVEDVEAAWEWCRFTLGLASLLPPTTLQPRRR